MTQALDNLAAATSALNDTANAIAAKVPGWIAQMQNNGTPDSALAPITDQLTAANAALQGAASALDAAMTPPSP